MKGIEFKEITDGAFDGKFNKYYLDELTQWYKIQTQSNLEVKAYLVYRKCLKSGKIGIADKIQEKYPNAFKIKSDLAMAMAFSMTAMKDTTEGAKDKQLNSEE